MLMLQKTELQKPRYFLGNLSHFARKIKCLLGDLFLDHFDNGLEDVL